MKLQILALLLAVVWASAPQPREAEHPTETAKQVQQQPNDNKQASNSLASIPVVPASPNPADTESAQKATQDKEKPVRITQPIAITTKPDYATWVFSALLVGVGALQVWLLRGTLQATKDNATAAKDTAHVAIQTERPWLVVTAQHHEEARRNFSFRVTNQGRTPARIIKQEIGAGFYPDPMTLPTPPPYQPDVIRLGLLVQDNSFTVCPIEPVRWAISRGVKEQAIDDARLFLCAYGRIIYEDLISRGTESAAPRETRWCFVYLAGEKRFVQSGPEEYNRYT